METADFEYIRDLCRRRSAIVLDLDKTYLIESKLLPLAQAEGLTTISALVAKMRVSSLGALQAKVIEAMTTNETSFFRDLQPFEALRKVILPELIARRSIGRQIRIWCAACSTGQEPYSISMLIEEHFPQLATWDVKILATDLCTHVLERARSGCFNQTEVNRGLPSTMLIKYFQRNGLNWQVNDRVRSRIEFRQLNLIETWPVMNTMDIVFIRNVLIYFDVQTKKQILKNVHRKLKPDGYLFLGGAESTFGIDDSFVRTEIEKSSIYRLRGHDGAAVSPQTFKRSV